MRKHEKRESTAPRAGNTIPLVITQAGNKSVDAPNEPVKRGKLSYLGKKKNPPVSPPKNTRPERKIFTQGRYIGDGNRLTAFVWLDDAPASD